MGDFNFRPDSEQYQLTVEVLEDTYLLSQQEVGIEGFDPSRRIDHVFVTPGTKVREAVYKTEPQSDHPAMFVVIEW
jgi:endonuclease/exonuclease/phosphatase family metal-dependent hydrolase